MSQNFFLTLSSFCIAMLITACRDLPKVEDENLKKILSRTNVKTGEREDFEYDSQGRIIEKLYSSGDKTTYSYGSNVISVSFFSNGTFDYSLNWQLNNNGYFDRVDLPNGQKIAIFYDNDGYLISIKYSYPDGTSSTETFTYVNGNNIRQTSGQYTFDKEYLEKQNTLSNEQMGMRFLGEDNRNLLLNITQQGGGQTVFTSYTYDLNDEGYVIKQFETIHYSNTPNFPQNNEYLYIYE